MQRQVCPLCALDEFVTVMETDDGEIELVCTNSQCNYAWQPTVAQAWSLRPKRDRCRSRCL